MSAFKVGDRVTWCGRRGSVKSIGSSFDPLQARGPASLWVVFDTDADRLETDPGFPGTRVQESMCRKIEDR